ncbi:MerR family transcriptional regulator [Nonomuraea glycinis]|uniref:MerR family transcriptional regulator n=2 Tax=Nonomuraea glycinis TaxID=2047744 RepID=A0A918E6B6_9ACTN|nr:MerR family transcriptional regulator [Nonomuraea glycinis]
MRMADLSAGTGVPVPTIKYYLREGLLSPGRPLGRNQAEYGSAHVKRLKLVRALADYGGLSISAIRELVDHMEDPGTAKTELLSVAQKTVTTHDDERSGEHVRQAERLVADLLARRGWDDTAGHQAARTMVGVLASLLELGLDDILRALDDYADAAETAAGVDLRVLGDVTDRERAVEVVVIGTLLGDTLLAAMRRLAQAHLSVETYRTTG